MSQHRTFQIKAMSFHITKHLLNPHAAFIVSQGQTSVRQIGRQTPGFFFAFSPMDQE
jgi:hypothetical protein